ncbi:GAF domain-containing sensor histidine kinase [Christiangramia echinicola]|uniref:histidine kinase n=1 Tax=Christiangramia echinicola TaxID=279359 RepID=A0A1H1NL04_9FLAO|nr:GAF domain-containing sensor histidine kinase [Christiangramia echinicola]SDR99684.1 Signal transduction histidine kinase [Christiangramia echinicola]
MIEVETISYNSEFQRIKKLSEFDLDYLEINDEVKNLVELAGMVAGTEISMLNLLDSNTQWTVSPVIEGPRQIPREDSVCNYTIQTKDGLEIQRLDLDERFSGKNFVQGETGLKYYLGIPLTLTSGENIGAICLADRVEKQTSNIKKKALRLIATEIVEKLEAKKKLNETVYSLSEAIRVKNQVAHDVRGPINGIAGLAEVVETEEVSTEEMKEYFKLIKDSGKGILDLTDDILDNGKDPDIFRSTYLNLQQLKEKLDKLYQLPAKSKQIGLHINFDPEKNWKFFPKRKLLSILGNLISNSIKFTPINGEVQVALDIKNSEQGKFIQTLITDTGKGFTANEIQEFYNNNLDCSIGSAGEKGFGLGLKLVNEMLKDLNGDMQISSTQDKGAKIEVRVPI